LLATSYRLWQLFVASRRVASTLVICATCRAPESCAEHFVWQQGKLAVLGGRPAHPQSAQRAAVRCSGSNMGCAPPNSGTCRTPQGGGGRGACDHEDPPARAAQVEASVVGRNCRIGRGAHLRGAYLLDGVAVGASAWVLGALVANGARVGDGAIVSPGAMLSFNARALAPRLAATPRARAPDPVVTS
jgi:hypothetical protein